MFSTKLETIKEEKSVNKDAARKELAELGAIKEGLEKEIAEYKQLALEYYGLDEKVCEKDVELQQLDIDINKAKKEITDLDLLKDNVSENKEIIKTLRKEITDLLHIKDEINTSITALSEDKAIKEAELNSAILDLETKLNKIKNEYITFERNAIKKVDEYDAKLLAKNEELDKLATEVIDGEKELKSLTSNRAKLSSELQSLNIAIKEETIKLVAETERANAKYDERMAEFETDKARKEEEYITKSGELSQKEAWLNEKEQKLLDLKVKMEAFHGKKIDGINL